MPAIIRFENDQGWRDPRRIAGAAYCGLGAVIVVLSPLLTHEQLHVFKVAFACLGVLVVVFFIVKTRELGKIHCNKTPQTP